MRARRLTGATAAAVVAVALAGSAAEADTWGQVDCDRQPRPPECRVVVIDRGTPDPGGSRTGDGQPTCRLNGQVVPCHEPGLGWLHSDGCYHSPDPRVGPGPHWWARACYHPATDSFSSGGWVQRTAPPDSVLPVVQRAADRLRLPQPAIAASPDLGGPQVVHVPVWWWIEPASWTTRSATAAIPALTISVEATPTRVTWSAGDGTATTCAGPGTPWTGGRDPDAASPTCGHTYTTTSASAPGGVYQLRAELTWRITWSGGGMSGTIPAITTSTTTRVTVTELRSVITR